MTEPVLYSACLLGVRCAYDGRDRSHRLLDVPLPSGVLPVPVCPEQLGGLPTPRVPAEILEGTGKDVLDGTARVVSRKGRDVTSAFLRGAEEVVRIGRALGCRRAVFSDGSPSCGSGWIYAGRFDGTRRPGCGVAAAALRAAGIAVSSSGGGEGSGGEERA
ncbi:MAG: DUF523 domain-containing protein [Bacillota bacterium]